MTCCLTSPQQIEVVEFGLQPNVPTTHSAQSHRADTHNIYTYKLTNYDKKTAAAYLEISERGRVNIFKSVPTIIFFSFP